MSGATLLGFEADQSGAALPYCELDVAIQKSALLESNRLSDPRGFLISNEVVVFSLAALSRMVRPKPDTFERSDRLFFVTGALPACSGLLSGP